MKKMSKSQMAVVAVVSLCIISAGIGVAKAATDTSKTNPMSGLVAAIAAKFNLNARDVQAVFDGQKTQMEADRKTKMAEMETKRLQDFADILAKAVSVGRLTQAQADLVTAKESELKAAQTGFEGKTPEERRAAMEAQAKSLKQWATDNNIPEAYLSGCGAGFGRGVAGTVSAVSGTTVTMTAKQPGSGTEIVYTIDASAAIIKKVAKAADAAAKPTETNIAVSDIAADDKLEVRGTVSGNNIVATQIVDGQMGGRGFGGGRRME